MQLIMQPFKGMVLVSLARMNGIYHQVCLEGHCQVASEYRHTPSQDVIVQLGPPKMP